MKSMTSSLHENNYQGMGRDMAERLGLGPEVRELKLGPTFTNNRSTAFHTLKYDFKPASVDVSKMATVDVGSNNTMTVTVPHLDGAGIPHTIFKGNQRPYHKECVLIIDRATGEITLEKLSSNIQVKKTRTEPKSQNHLTVPLSNSGGARPNTPIEMRRSPTHGRSTSRTKVSTGKKREPTVQLHSKQPQHYQQPSPLQISPFQKSPPNAPNNSSPGFQQSTLASLPVIGMDSDDFVPSSSHQPPPVHSSAPPRTSSPAINSRAPLPKPKITTDKDGAGAAAALSDSSCSSSSSDSSDSDSDTENVPVPPASSVSNGTSSPALLMPNNLLSDDLQLSESESD